MTNPPYAEVKIEWIRDLKFTLILTRDSKEKYRVYLDSENSDVVPSKLDLKIDPSVFDRSWYEKIAVSPSLLVGSAGLTGGLNLTYDFTDDMYAGVGSTLFFTGKKMYTFYGVTGGFYLFR